MYKCLEPFIKINLSKIDEESTGFALKVLEVMLQANNENLNSAVVSGLPVNANYLKVIYVVDELETLSLLYVYHFL